MCGISGIINHPQSVEKIEHMIKSLHHRGPDATGKYISDDGFTALGHNRLSIIDLSTNANQPMRSKDGRYFIVLNGEIYNYLELREELKHSYVFTTQSDTEVLLAAFIKWKELALTKLNGMFAFAIWDTEKKELFVARDRFGVKPFYYSQQEDTFYFASEIKALWVAGIEKTKNDTVWANYFCHGSYGLPNETFWKNIYQLKGGHWLTFSAAKGIHTKQWYFFNENIEAKIEANKPYQIEEYKTILANTIKLRCKSDVPVAFNISGGVDSSLLLALVNQSFPKSAIEAYTFYTGDVRYDELPWVEKIIEQTKNPLVTCKLNIEEVPELFDEISQAQDEPFGGIPTIAYSNIFKTAKARGIKVLLDGQGMDEAWAGYDYYHNNNNQTTQGLTESPYLPDVLENDFKSLVTTEKYPTPFNCDLMNKQYRDLFYTKIPRALRFNDRISMLYSTELREPFLDYRLVEWAFAQPKENKIRNGETKWQLRNLASTYLDTAITYSPKRALQTPQREWLSGELADWAREKIKYAEKSGFLKKGKAENAFDNFCKNPQQSIAVWQFINLSAFA